MKKSLFFLSIMCTILLMGHTIYAKDQETVWAEEYVGWWSAANPSAQALFVHMEVRSAKQVFVYDAQGAEVGKGSLSFNDNVQINLGKIGQFSVRHIPPRIHDMEATEEIPPAITLEYGEFIEDFEKQKKAPTFDFEPVAD